MQPTKVCQHCGLPNRGQGKQYCSRRCCSAAQRARRSSAPVLTGPLAQLQALLDVSGRRTLSGTGTVRRLSKELGFSRETLPQWCYRGEITNQDAAFILSRLCRFWGLLDETVETGADEELVQVTAGGNRT